jgi:hypothetical protein
MQTPSDVVPHHSRQERLSQARCGDPDPPSRHHLPTKTGSSERRCLPARGGQAIAPRFHGLGRKAQATRQKRQEKNSIRFSLAPSALRLIYPPQSSFLGAPAERDFRLASNALLVIRRSVQLSGFMVDIQDRRRFRGTLSFQAQMMLFCNLQNAAIGVKRANNGQQGILGPYSREPALARHNLALEPFGCKVSL